MAKKRDISQQARHLLDVVTGDAEHDGPQIIIEPKKKPVSKKKSPKKS